MKTLLPLFLFMGFLLTQCGRETPTIALLTPLTHPSLEEIEKGFRETFGDYRIKTFNAQGNPTLMRQEVNEMASGQYSLVFTIGASATVMTKEVFAKKSVKTPIVFGAIIKPESLGILPSENITGAIEEMDYVRYLNKAFETYPQIKTLLLVYDPGQYALEAYVEEIASLLKERHVVLDIVPIFSSQEMATKVSVKIDRADAVLVLKDNTVVSALDTLVKLCRKANIPLLASDLDSPERGANFAYGVSEYAFGKIAAEQAKEILATGSVPPPQRVNDYQLVVKP